MEDKEKRKVESPNHCGFITAQHRKKWPPDISRSRYQRCRDTRVFCVVRNVLANGRSRWLALIVSVGVSGAMLYAQATESRCCLEIPAVAPASPESASGAAGYIASPAEAQSLAASAPAAGQEFKLALPTGVASENGLQLKTIWAARAISVMFPQVTKIFGFRQDALKWHPNGVGDRRYDPEPWQRRRY